MRIAVAASTSCQKNNQIVSVRGGPPLIDVRCMLILIKAMTTINEERLKMLPMASFWMLVMRTSHKVRTGIDMTGTMGLDIRSCKNLGREQALPTKTIRYNVE